MDIALLGNVISYRRIADAIAYYTKCGYQYVEVAWDAPQWAVNVTCPDQTRMLPSVLPECMLVGSAEQVFIALYAMGALPKGKYVACTPCFRPGDLDDDLHQETFMKVELFRTDHTDYHALNEIISEAAEFFRSQMKYPEYSLIRASDSRFETDITLNGVEIGSYGIRQHGSLVWVYGTGVAEPRFSMAIERSPSADAEWRCIKGIAHA